MRSPLHLRTMGKGPRYALLWVIPLAILACSAAARAQPPSLVAPDRGATRVSDANPSNGDRLQKWLTQNGLVRQVSGRASDLVINALSFLGVKYKYGGDHASTGFDCSGFVRHVYRQTLGLVLPHNAAQQSREGQRIAENQLRPGDLVFFNTLRRAFSHVGIYIGNGQFIHAPRPGQDVQIGSLDSPYWARRFDGARRLISRATDAVPEAQATAVGDSQTDHLVPASALDNTLGTARPSQSATAQPQAVDSRAGTDASR